MTTKFRIRYWASASMAKWCSARIASMDESMRWKCCTTMWRRDVKSTCIGRRADVGTLSTLSMCTKIRTAENLVCSSLWNGMCAAISIFYFFCLFFVSGEFPTELNVWRNVEYCGKKKQSIVCLRLFLMRLGFHVTSACLIGVLNPVIWCMQFAFDFYVLFFALRFVWRAINEWNIFFSWHFIAAWKVANCFSAYKIDKMPDRSPNAVIYL